MPRHDDRLRARDRHQGLDDPQELGRDLRPGEGRSGQSARRHLVGRHRRSAHAGRRGRPDGRIQVAEDERAAGLGDAPVGAVQGHARSASIRARSASATTPSCVKSKGLARAEMLGRPPQRRSSRTRSRSPTRTRRAPPTRCWRRSCRSWARTKGFDYLKALHKNVNQYTKSGAAPAKAAALGETTVGITFLHDMVTMVVDKAPIKARAALRRHRLRDRLDVDHQGREKPRQRQEVLRLGADARRRRSSAPRPNPIRCRRTRTRRFRRRRRSSRTSS